MSSDLKGVWELGVGGQFWLRRQQMQRPWGRAWLVYSSESERGERTGCGLGREGAAGVGHMVSSQ